ncbi:glycosyltransferase family 87 protein [Pararhodobacter zhoushanensis]|uniref:glycosyltransferase family 87 protein n=1 Tax=Pararhodobacter zhoushanensis TaxID=2479545 RepID=UPI000F8E35F6|nr:glycosyltransferase family 87 protein [Pararhodobacter zhoushanensis]
MTASQDIAPQTAPPSRLLRNRVLALVLIGFFYLAIYLAAQMRPTLGAGNSLVDFDAFYIVGQLIAEGRAAQAYDPAVMAEIQSALLGHNSFMPWTYPPMFDLVVAPLPLLPRGIAYALFTGVTLAFYLAMIARLSGTAFLAVLLTMTPLIYINVNVGQNAFLTGGLVAVFVALSLRGKTSAGLPLGLMVIKPHLAVGLGVHALIAGRWRVLAVACTVALAFAALATLAFGPDIWTAFRSGVAAASHALSTDFYPLFLMTSVYALLHSLGVPPQIALWVQIGIGLTACALIALAVRARLPLHQTLAIACFGSALVSPYLYAYDMTIAGVGLALIARDLLARATTVEKTLLLVLVWLACGWGLVHAHIMAGMPWEQRTAVARDLISYGAVAYLLVLALTARILRRPVEA